MDPDNPTWLTNTFSSACGSHFGYDTITKDAFMNFGTKIGLEDQKLEEMFNAANTYQDGYLNLDEQDAFWVSYLQDQDDTEGDQTEDDDNYDFSDVWQNPDLWDWDQLASISEDDFLTLCTYLSYDMSLMYHEKQYALMQY